MLALCLPTLASELEGAESTLADAAAKAGTDTLPLVDVDEVPGGWVKLANRLICRALDASADYIAFLQANFRGITAGWGVRMIEALELDWTYGAAGPSIPCGTRPQKWGRRGMAPAVRVVDLICYSGVVFKRAVFEDVGLLDEEYIHYGSDYDHIRRMQQRGWQVVYVPDVYIEHDWQPLKYPEWKRHDAALYYDRWGKGRG